MGSCFREVFGPEPPNPAGVSRFEVGRILSHIGKDNQHVSQAGRSLTVGVASQHTMVFKAHSQGETLPAGLYCKKRGILNVDGYFSTSVIACYRQFTAL